MIVGTVVSTTFVESYYSSVVGTTVVGRVVPTRLVQTVVPINHHCHNDLLLEILYSGGILDII